MPYDPELGNEFPIDDGRSDIAHRRAASHSGRLNESECVVFGKAVTVHQDAFGSVHEFANLELIEEVFVLFGKGEDFSMTCQRHLDRRNEIVALPRFHEVCQGSRFSSVQGICSAENGVAPGVLSHSTFFDIVKLTERSMAGG